MRTWSSLVALAFLAGFGPSSAFGQPRLEDKADALFRAGRESMRRGDYVSACTSFAESQRLDPAAGTLLNIGTCEEKQGHFASAWQRYRDAASQLASGDPRRAMAVSAAAALERRIARITIKLAAGAPPETEVARAGSVAGAVSIGIELAMDPGVHLLRVSAAGWQDRHIEITARAGHQQAIEISPGRPVSESSTDAGHLRPERSATSGAEAGPREPGADRRTIGWILVGAGAVAEGAAIYFAFDARSKDEEAQKYCRATECWDQAGLDWTEKSQRSGRYATIAAVGGGIAAAGGLVLVFAWPDSDEPAAGSVTVRTATARGTAGLVLGGNW